MVATVWSSVLAATITLLGFSIGWFSSPTNASVVPAQSLLAVEEPKPVPVIPPQAGVPVKPFIIVVKTDQETSTIEDASFLTQFKVPLNRDFPYDFTINWGDGVNEVITRELVTKEINPKHTYDKPGTYTIQITENEVGGFPAIFFAGQGDCKKIIEISQWGGNTWINMTDAFCGCENLTITATDAVNALTRNVSEFTRAWSGCKSLTSFPSLNTAAGTNFSSAWGECSGLTSFPLLNTAAGTNFSSAWFNCSGLTSFPLLDTARGTDFMLAWAGCSGLMSFPLLNTSAGTNFHAAWAGCSGLTSFPLLDTSAGTHFAHAWVRCSDLTSFPLLNTAAGTDFSFAWAECSGLTSFPLLNTAAGIDFGNAWADCRGLTSFPLLNTSAGTMFDFAWKNCRGLTDFPLLNTAAGIYFIGAWNDCRGLTSFPLLNTAAGTYFASTWSGCSALTSFPLLNLGKMKLGKECFAGVSLESASYAKLLDHIAALNVSPEVEFDGGLSQVRSLMGTLAREKLIKKLGWTIYDGDHPKSVPGN